MSVNKVFLSAAFLLLAAVISAEAASSIIVPVLHRMAEPNASVLNITSSVDDYVILHERQYDLNIYLYNLEIDAAKTAYRQQYLTLDVQVELLSFKLREELERINPLELLDDWSKHCVQKYRHQYQQIEKYQTSINTCKSSASSYNALSSAETTRNQLKSYYSGTYRTAQNNCKKSYGNDTESVLYKNCALKAVDQANIYTLTNRNTFDTQMLSGIANSDIRIDSVLQCSLEAFYTAANIMNTTMNSIQACIDGPADCIKGSGLVSTAEAVCNNVVDMIVHENDFYNATMRNPLFDVDHNLQCLQVNLWRK